MITFQPGTRVRISRRLMRLETSLEVEETEKKLTGKTEVSLEELDTVCLSSEGRALKGGWLKTITCA